MKAQELSQKYAAAIFSQALEKWTNALQTVQGKLASDAALAKKLQDSSLSFESRKKDLDKILPADSDQYIRNFFYTMLKEGDLALLGDVLTSLDHLTRGGPQVQTARVTTAYPLNDSEKEQFQKQLRQKYGQGIELVFNIDSSIVGGVIVQIGDKLIDGSVAARLESMGNLLGVKK